MVVSTLPHENQLLRWRPLRYQLTERLFEKVTFWNLLTPCSNELDFQLNLGYAYPVRERKSNEQAM